MMPFAWLRKFLLPLKKRLPGPCKTRAAEVSDSLASVKTRQATAAEQQAKLAQDIAALKTKEAKTAADLAEIKRKRPNSPPFKPL
ncbi:MAG: hypothetical protein H6574_18485 [Lewinellaceae bacterium]|nr:hypothetical protein [Lewinellaceae bacterium]